MGGDAADGGISRVSETIKPVFTFINSLLNATSGTVDIENLN